MLPSSVACYLLCMFVDTVFGTEEFATSGDAAVVVILVEQFTTRKTRVIGCIPGKQRHHVEQLTLEEVEQNTGHWPCVYLGNRDITWNN